MKVGVLGCMAERLKEQYLEEEKYTIVQIAYTFQV